MRTLSLLTFCSLLIAQPPAPEMREGQQLLRQGKLEEAGDFFRQQLEKSPDSPAANNAMGVYLDLTGKSADAKKYFAKAIDLAPNPQAKAAAQRAMAMSYAFQGDCANTAKYEQMVFDYWVQEKNFYQQGEMANEAARVCIEAGDYNTAEKFYKLGTEVGLKEPDIKPDRVSLWKFRLEHALARLAARRGQKTEAAKHVAAAKAILDADPEMAKQQAVFFPYLTGYVALYTGDPKTALADLLKANQTDPFIQCLVGMAYEKLGDKEKAMQMYRVASTTVAHNPPAAYAKFFTAKKLQ